jgi:hypothetical protein
MVALRTQDLTQSPQIAAAYGATVRAVAKAGTPPRAQPERRHSQQIKINQPTPSVDPG